MINIALVGTGPTGVYAFKALATVRSAEAVTIWLFEKGADAGVGMPYSDDTASAVMLANIASVFILGLGIIAALNQIGIALTVTLPVLIAILGTIGGILVVGVGGGLIQPMRHRWEDYLNKAEQESRNLRDTVSSSPDTSRPQPPNQVGAPPNFYEPSAQQQAQPGSQPPYDYQQPGYPPPGQQYGPPPGGDSGLEHVLVWSTWMSPSMRPNGN